MHARDDERATTLAHEIYRRYLDVTRGACRFIERDCAEEVGRRLAVVAPSTKPIATLFDACMPFISLYLQRLHAAFLVSDAFVALLNRLNVAAAVSTAAAAAAAADAAAADDDMIAQQPSTSSATIAQRETRSVERVAVAAAAAAATATPRTSYRLTHDVLMRSQAERERLLGQR